MGQIVARTPLVDITMLLVRRKNATRPMRIVVHPLTFDTLGDLAGTAATNTFWTTQPGTQSHNDTASQPSGPAGQPRNADSGNPRLDKELWMHNTLTTWGPCAFTAYVTSGADADLAVPAATVVFAPPASLPGRLAFPTGPVSDDAVLISTVHVPPPYQGLFLEHRLIDAAVDELSRRGVRAVECFAVRPTASPADKATSPLIPRHAPILCSDVLEERGFEVAADDPAFPRYRMELPDTGNRFAAVEESLWEATVTMGFRIKVGMGAH